MYYRDPLSLDLEAFPLVRRFGLPTVSIAWAPANRLPISDPASYFSKNALTLDGCLVSGGQLAHDAAAALFQSNHASDERRAIPVLVSNQSGMLRFYVMPFLCSCPIIWNAALYVMHPHRCASVYICLVSCPLALLLLHQNILRYLSAHLAIHQLGLVHH